MRYHLDTIPVWDAFAQGGECPLCDLREQNERSYVESFLGASVMEPDVRIEVNAKGFCGPHFSQMIAMKNRLGLALMTHTHFKQTLEALGTPPRSPKKRGLWGNRALAAAAEEGDTCILCERLRNTMDRYLYTTLHLWKTDAEFAKVLQEGKGLCLPHYRRLLDMAAQALSAEQAEAFTRMLEAVERRNMERIEAELQWFTLKFDYRNADKPWDNSKDSLERAINKLRGKYV